MENLNVTNMVIMFMNIEENEENQILSVKKKYRIR